MNIFEIFIIFFILVALSGVNTIFAQTTNTINILGGASNSESSVFWQDISSGRLTGTIVITQGEFVKWVNQDSVDHTITSGNPNLGPNGVFDSGLFGNGENFSFQFTEVGEYPYYCTLHPWLVGIISVAQPYMGREQIIQNVGKEYDRGGNGLEINYILEGTLSDSVAINQEKKSVTFYYEPLQSKEDVLIITLPEHLIKDITYTQVNGEIIPDAIRENIQGITTMYVPLWPDSREVTFVGEQVISLEAESEGGCLIATATYGSELAPQVQQLRELRDNKLLQTKSGVFFMKNFNEFYYFFSPAIADYERENQFFKEVVKLVITPMISSLSVLNHVNIDSEAEVLGYGLSLILFNTGIYGGIPAIIIISIKRKF